MAGKKTLKIDYTSDAVSALKSCRTYLEAAVAFLNDKADLPDASHIARAAFHPNSLQNARICDGALGLSLPAIEVTFDDSPRYFDPWYFVAIRLLELPGGRIKLGISKRDYSYVTYGPRGHYLTRIIADTPWWSDTKLSTSEHGYRDYRRSTLRWEAKNIVRALGLETRRTSRLREDAIMSAKALFREQLAAHFGSKGSRRALPGLNLNLGQYEGLLRTAFDIADAVNEKVLSSKAKQAAHKQGNHKRNPL